MTHPFGSLFPESLIKEQRRMKHHQIHSTDMTGISVSRIIFFISVMVLGLGLLLARLIYLTIIEGNRFHQLAQTNRIRDVNISAPRGIIYDRNGIPLVRNIPGKIISATPSAESIESVAREYIFGKSLSHLLGFTGEISEVELRVKNSELRIKNMVSNMSYKLGDIVGKMGIEASYDRILRGVDGRQLTEVDALGNQMRVLGRIEPIAGKNLTLSIDSNLQKIAAGEFQDKKGAIIVTNPANGEILALFSAPAFDPNRFIKGDKVEEILDDPNQPLFNRVIAGVYPPGSTFKIVTALSALEDKVIDKNTKLEDTGILQVGDYTFATWYFTQYGKKEGLLNIVDALKRSNDIFFYKTGELLGIDRLAAWARKLGVETILGIDIPGEEKGVMPDPTFREKTFGESWYLGNTYHVAIGQGDLLVTPLQVNAWTNVIANGGKLCRPHLISDPKYLGNLSNLCKNLGIKQETIGLIREGMRQACAPGGTGWPLFNFKVTRRVIPSGARDPQQFQNSFRGPSPTPYVVAQDDTQMSVACKTGTAEFTDPKGRTHAWFTIFAPVTNPQISVTVLVEGGGEGSSVAAPIAKKILEAYFGS